MRPIRLIAGIATAAAVIVGVTACSGSMPGNGGASGSRAVLYSNLDALEADSAIVVSGETVRLSTDVSDTGLPITYVTLRVDEVFEPSSLGENLPADLLAEADRVDVGVGDQILVKQYGSADAPGEFPPLTERSRYLLFLVPTMQEGEDASTFYVVGANAGIYAADNDAFSRAYPDSGDSLPMTLTTADLGGAR